jgi:hypothetical protein
MSVIDASRVYALVHVLVPQDARQSNSVLVHAQRHAITRQSSSVLSVCLCMLKDKQTHARAVAWCWCACACSTHPRAEAWCVCLRMLKDTLPHDGAVPCHHFNNAQSRIPETSGKLHSFFEQKMKSGNPTWNMALRRFCKHEHTKHTQEQ